MWEFSLSLTEREKSEEAFPLSIPRIEGEKEEVFSPEICAFPKYHHLVLYEVILYVYSIVWPGNVKIGRIVS
jgi:hypothetical protein